MITAFQARDIVGTVRGEPSYADRQATVNQAITEAARADETEVWVRNLSGEHQRRLQNELVEVGFTAEIRGDGNLFIRWPL